jgi:hypothetical protein
MMVHGEAEQRPTEVESIIADATGRRSGDAAYRVKDWAEKGSHAMRWIGPNVGAICLAVVVATAAIAAPAATHGASTPVAHVKAILSKLRGHQPRCVHDWDCIPMTDRIIKRIQAIESHEHGVDPLTRVQNTANRNTYRLLSDKSGVALVEWVMYLQPTFRLTYVVKHTADGWRIDDNYCSGKPGTSLYSKHGLIHC